MKHAVEHLEGAALTLVRPGSVKDRLACAYREHLAVVDSGQLPKEVHEQFDSLRRAMQRERPLYRGEDAVHATVRKMSVEEAEGLAVSIVRMFGLACGRAAHQGNTASPVSVVKLYAAEH